MKSLLKYTAELDQLSPTENNDLAKAVKSVEKFIKSSAKISEVKYATRDAHSKTYATAKATLKISEDLPNFITAIFDQKEYELLARFSNANLVINKKGRDTPLYGFSIKIKNVNGQDANFPLVNFPLFPTNSPSVFLNLFRSVNTFLVTKQDNFLVSVLDLPSLIKNGLSLFSSMFSFDVIKKIIQFIPKRKDFFFSFNFDGIGCYRIGDHIMKIGLKPVRNLSGIGENESQQESITEFISLQDSNFLLTIQLCENLENQPVNDLMKTWKNAPEYVLGKIVIPQDSTINSEKPEIENLNFNPFEN
ncbi:MAG: hypothetical protein LC112_01245, partial [Flavobacteriales bacterium]|nr:hypothetical protein [Flavobacteriales bacterium]